MTHQVKSTQELPAFEKKPQLQKLHAPTLGDKLRRLIWGFVHSTLFTWSPVPAHGWRAGLLRLFGARLSGKVYIYPSTRVWAPWNLEMAEGACLGPRVDCYNVAKVKLAEGALVSQGTYLCSASHDHNDPAFPLIGGDIILGRFAWVAAEAFVAPGVAIGDEAVVGARSVVVRDVACSDIVVGNPARRVSRRERSRSGIADA